jgi:hypothetical protein
LGCLLKCLLGPLLVYHCRRVRVHETQVPLSRLLGLARLGVLGGLRSPRERRAVQNVRRFLG